LFQFIRDQEAKKNGQAKADENKSDFPKHNTERVLLKVQDGSKRELHFRLVDAAESKSEIMENFITKDGYNQP
jgi:hypothetical protein